MADLWKFTLPLLGAIIAWTLNQWKERSKDEYLRKEKLYRGLLDALQGFYDGPPTYGRPATLTVLNTSAPALQRRQAFLDQVKLMWLYSPDEVIRTVYAFLHTVHAQREEPASDTEKEMALGEIVAAIRRDLLRPRFIVFRKTKLTGADYRDFKVVTG